MFFMQPEFVHEGEFLVKKFGLRRELRLSLVEGNSNFAVNLEPDLLLTPNFGTKNTIP